MVRPQTTYSIAMHLPSLLRRLLPPFRRADTEKARHSAAARLREETQAHYRAVTESDASGRSTRIDNRKSADDR